MFEALINVILLCTEVLRADYIKPVPFRNKYYFNQWVPPKAPLMPPKPATQTVTQTAKQQEPNAEPDPKSEQEPTAAQEPMADEQNSADDFIINRPKPQKRKIVKSPKGSKSQQLLRRAAKQRGQTKVRDFFLTESEESEVVRDFFFGNVVNLSDSEDESHRCPEKSVIVIDSDSDEKCTPIVVMETHELSGPIFASSPVSDTQIYEHPSQSPIY